MKHITQALKKEEFPIRVVQFGEGRLLRALIDPAIQAACDAGRFQGTVAVVKPTGRGNLQLFREQDCLYTVVLRGRDGGSVTDAALPITCIRQAVSPYEDFPGFLALARLPEVEFVVSNTTEAGISLDPQDRFDSCPPASFPGKLTRFFYERYAFFHGEAGRGLTMLPTELIEGNGPALRRCVLALAEQWNLEEGFRRWVEESCRFCSTLVDRIVSGCPEEELPALWQRFGYQDRLADVGEPFGLWAIEAGPEVAERFPIDLPGSPALFVKDVQPYKQRKVRILNGGHTSMVPAAFLMGKDIVRQCMEEPLLRAFLEKAEEEIIPFVPLPRQESEAFARAVMERFENPFLEHRLLEICTNTFPKWRERVLPTVLDSMEAGKFPRLLVFSFAAMLAFYTVRQKGDGGLFGLRGGVPYPLRDMAEPLELAEQYSGKTAGEYTAAAVHGCTLFQEELPRLSGFEKTAAGDLERIREKGIAAALRQAMEEAGK